MSPVLWIVIAVVALLGGLAYLAFTKLHQNYTKYTITPNNNGFIEFKTVHTEGISDDSDVRRYPLSHFNFYTQCPDPDVTVHACIKCTYDYLSDPSIGFVKAGTYIPLPASTTIV